MEIQIRRQIEIKPRNGFEHDAAQESKYTLSDLLPPISHYTRKMSATQITTTTTSTTTKKLERKYTVGTISEKDSDEVLSLLKKFFFEDEPLNTYVQLGECKELEDYCTSCIPGGCSFKAVDPTGKIIGVMLSSVYNRPTVNDAEPAKLADSCKNEKFKKIMGLMDFIDTQFSIFDQFPDVDKFLDGKIMSVDTTYRGMGIACELTNHTINYMVEHQIPLIQVLCTSFYSAQAMEKLKFEEVFALPFSDYLNENGEQVLKPAEPHVSARIMIKKVKF